MPQTTTNSTWICRKPLQWLHCSASSWGDSLNTGKPKTGQRFAWIIRDSTRCDASMILRNTLNLPKTAHRLFRVKRPRRPQSILFALTAWLWLRINNLIFHFGVEKRTLVTQIMCNWNFFRKCFPKWWELDLANDAARRSNKRKLKEIKDSKKTGPRYDCEHCEYKAKKTTPRNTHTRFSWGSEVSLWSLQLQSDKNREPQAAQKVSPWRPDLQMQRMWL